MSLTLLSRMGNRKVGTIRTDEEPTTITRNNGNNRNMNNSSNPYDREDTKSKPKSLDQLIRRIRNGTLYELFLGWRESDFVQKKRQAVMIEYALKKRFMKDNKKGRRSNLTSISFGWRLNNSQTIPILLRAIGKYCCIEHIKIVFISCSTGWIPEYEIKNLLALQKRSLQSIDIRSVEVRKKYRVTGRICCPHHAPNSNNNIKDTKTAVVFPGLPNKRCDHNIVSRVIVYLFNHVNLQKLNLMDCNIDDLKVKMLADYITSRNKGMNDNGISELSLRMNKRISPIGLKYICQAPIRDTLDLSLCGLRQADAIAIAEGISSRQMTLRNLKLSGNYQIGTLGLLSLVSHDVCKKIISLDISYCDINQYCAYSIFNSLKEITSTSSSLLHEVYMRGAKVANNIVTNAINGLLKQSKTLRVLELNDPNNRSEVMTPDQMRTILDGLINNFQLEILEIDFLNCSAERLVWKDISFHLDLNRAGRRVLITKSPSSADISTMMITPIQQQQQQGQKRHHNSYIPNTDCSDWFQVLANAGQNEDLNVLYWIVRHGADHF